MPVSDDDYVQELSDEDVDSHVVTRGSGDRASAQGSATRGGGGFEVARTWETVVEGEDGTLDSTVEGFLDAGKRKRYVDDELVSQIQLGFQCRSFDIISTGAMLQLACCSFLW
jgi:transcription initiation factor TFIIH subunit 2